MARGILGALQLGFKESGLTYEKFGKKVGITKSTAHRKLHGDLPITIADAEVWARKLNVQISCYLR